MLEDSSHKTRSCGGKTKVTHEMQDPPACDEIGGVGVVLDVADGLTRGRALSR